MTCIFCSIVAHQIPATILYEDEFVTAFQDTHPITPVHILVVPNQHIDSLNDLQPEHTQLLGHMLLVAHKMAEQARIEKSGYRVVFNTGPNAGQSVHHLHLHVLGGRLMPFHFE